MLPAALFLGGLLFAGAPQGPPAAAAQPPVPEAPENFTEEITVALAELTVRVVDGLGNPVLGLAPRDFRVLVGSREVPVVAVDWIGSDEPLRGPSGKEPPPRWEGPQPPVAEEAPAEPAPGSLQGPGQLVVVFVQADLEPTRISGQLRLRPYTRELLARLHPADRVAVVSYDSHLKLWLDFTRDRAAVHAAVDRAMIYGDPGDPVPGTDGASLARSFDPAAAARVASPERALEALARSLATLPGEKSIVYLGWGLGRFGADGVHMTPAFAPAVRALAAAHATVFVLDVTSADFHSLEVGLQAVAEATGGTYAKTNVLPGLATQALARTLAGHYVLTLDRGALANLSGAVRVELRGRSGTVLARPVTVR